MMFREDFRPAHVAYSKGLQISIDKERINKHVIAAAFQAAMCTSHLELFYREFYTDGAAWGLKISGKGSTARYWCEEYWPCYHMTLAGLSELPQKGAWLRPILDGNSVMALGHADFTALMTNEKSFTEMRWREISTTGVIGPVREFHQVTGAGNFANAAQIPNCLTQMRLEIKVSMRITTTCFGCLE